MNATTDFPVASRVKFLRGSVVAYEGIVAMHPSFNTKDGIKIEQGNKTQLSFAFITKLNGNSGWVLIPDPLPKGYAISQDVMLLSIKKE